jgi:hypothetical protein
MTDTVTKLELVKQARALERLLVRRRRVVKTLTALDDEIRTARKLLRDLTAPDPMEVYREPLETPAP